MKTYYHHKHGALKDAKVSKTSNLPSDKSLKRTIIITVLVLLALTAGSYLWYKESLRPAGKGESKSFIVAKGDSVGDIMDRLKNEGLIKSSLSLKLHARINGTYTKLKVGTYSISPELSGPQIVEIISGGRVSNAKLTILAGKTVQDVLPELYQHFGQDQVQQTLGNLTSDFHPLLASQSGLPDVNLEGYFLPETYTDLNSGVSFEQWLKRNFDLYTERIAPLQSQLAARGLTVHQAFTLASIIQKESSKPEEQKKIAQVFESRLQNEIPLGADPTFMYAARLAGVEPTPTINSPYNTRIVKGLPPTPIGTFEMTALDAVANPAQTDFLFFVAGDDGVIYYTYSEEEHQAAIQAHCQKLCN